MPVHQVNVVGTALVSDPVNFTNLGMQFECIISDYIAKDKPTEIPITLFHPNGSRLKNQTTLLKRGSSIFFSGSMTSIEGKLYLELHNMSFMRSQQQTNHPSKPKEMPWSQSSSSSSSSLSTPSTLHKKVQEQQSLLGKRESITKFQPNKMTKLSDIASNALEMAETIEEDKVQKEFADVITPESTPSPVKNKRSRAPRTKKG